MGREHDLLLVSDIYLLWPFSSRSAVAYLSESRRDELIVHCHDQVEMWPPTSVRRIKLPNCSLNQMRCGCSMKAPHTSSRSLRKEVSGRPNTFGK